MVYGPPGAGKKTRVMAMLRETFGSGVEKVWRVSFAFRPPGPFYLTLPLFVS